MTGESAVTGISRVIRSRTRQNFELVHINGPVQNFGPPARNFGPLRAEFAWREWRKMLGGHVANWAGLSGFLPQENKISRTFFIDFINTLRPRQNGRHFADDIFKRIFLNENIWISIKISLKFVPKGSINNISALVQIMAWRRPGDKPLSEPMMVNLPTHICVTRPQWVNKHSKVSNVDNSDDCHGVFNGGMSNKGWSFSRSRFDCLGLMHFCHG